ncbi:MAG: hypothetical protein DHS20C14_10970 [Phycisphaeraceae bacterium]|nr:MAG: hypothetical protein DHS20C14_10970 [Phycisphaeraceae bacterium]
MARVAALVCVCGLAASAFGAAAGAPAADNERDVPVAGKRVARFIIEDPTAQTSPASRLNDDRADKAGNIPEPTPGYTMTSRIIVQTSDVEALRAQTAAPAAAGVRNATATPRVISVEPFGTVGGFAVVETASVGDAIELAASLRTSGAYEAVELACGRDPELRGPNEPKLAAGDIWHLRNDVLAIADINADGAWDMGYTGAGVTVGVVEGGFQDSHPDLSGNNDPSASQSVGESSHGTGVAGIAAAVGDNGIGAVGLAYNANLSELNGASFDPAINAAAFAFANHLNDVKNNSWGPSDDGTLHDWSALERQAIEDSVNLGRGGLGTIVCWAAGNGGPGDRVEYDPYASNRHVFAIGAIGDGDFEAWYNELGSSMLVVTHSDGNNRGTYTTSTGSSYTSNFGGTSSASPLGMGAVALALEANPNMSWRDMMHALVETARKNDPTDSNWTTNAAGHDISYAFGFGAIDVGALCAAAETWTAVAAEVSAATGVEDVSAGIPDNNTTGLTRTVTLNDDITIESFELIMNATHPYVGDLHITVTSPAGTDSIVSLPRSDSQDDLIDYVFTSMRSFGESSQGLWSVTVSDRGNLDVGTWDDFEIKVYGTASSSACTFADCDANGVLNVDDIDCYVAAFLGGDLAAADCDSSGVLNVDDIDCFVADFLAGCP